MEGPRRVVHLSVLAVLVSGVCLAQPAANSRPASTNTLGGEYPRVTDDSRVLFQFKAPGAQRVQADIMGARYDVVNDGAGIWSVTTPTCPAGRGTWRGSARARQSPTPSPAASGPAASRWTREASSTCASSRRAPCTSG